MSELLLRVTPSGLIKKRHIGDDNSNKHNAQSIQHMMNHEDFDTIKTLMQHNTISKSIDNIMINDTAHFIFIHQIGIHYLFYANDRLPKDAQHAIINIIKAFSIQYMQPDDDSNEKKHFLYDSIQKLNNEVINKQRETAKLNQKLNRANAILNNRLVKDPLTKLVSRYQYRDEILMTIHENPDAYGMFWFLDIDNFKGINDTYGHQCGDDVLIEIAHRLKELPFENTIKMRIAGDEFGLYIAGVKSISDDTIEDTYQTFVSKVIKPVLVKDKEIPISFSVGIAIYNKDASDLHQLIDYADFAMYQAKQNGKNQYRLFNKDTYDTYRT